MDTVMKKPLDIIALLRTAIARETFRQSISDENVIAQIMVMPPHLNLAALRALRGDVFVVDMDVTNPTEMRALAEFVADEHSPPVVVTAPDLDVTSMRAIMRLGILDVIPQPFERADVIAAVRAALDRRQNGLLHARQCPLISFIGSSGGVGTTTLAVQGACSIARGKDASDLCLIDLDLQFGTAALLMDVEQRTSIVDLARDPERLDGALLRGSTVRAKDRFDLLAAPADVQAMELDPVGLAATLSIARSQYSHVIVDVPRLWSQWTFTVLQMSSVIVLVVELGVPSLKLARRQIDWMIREGLGHIPLVVVANRVESGLFKKQLSSPNCEKALGRRIDHMIPNDPAFRMAADIGQAVRETSGGGSVDKKLVAMMKDILSRDTSVSASAGA